MAESFPNLTQNWVSPDNSKQYAHKETHTKTQYN